MEGIWGAHQRILLGWGSRDDFWGFKMNLGGGVEPKESEDGCPRKREMYVQRP